VIVYLAAPIDFDAGSQVTRTKNEIKKHFKDQDCTWVYDPAGAWNAPKDLVPDEFVHWANLKVLEDADLLVAVLLKDVFTIGTIVEIQHAVDCGIPVIVIGDVGMNSVALAALEVQTYESIKEWSEYGSPIVPRTDADWYGTN
jgi:nucleoside 2-deoxyribosyltransferase